MKFYNSPQNIEIFWPFGSQTYGLVRVFLFGFGFWFFSLSILNVRRGSLWARAQVLTISGCIEMILLIVSYNLSLCVG